MPARLSGGFSRLSAAVAPVWFFQTLDPDGIEAHFPRTAFADQQTVFVFRVALIHVDHVALDPVVAGLGVKTVVAVALRFGV